MPRTVEVHDLDDEVYARLAQRAAEAGISVPELLRRHAERLAAHPSIEQWLARIPRRSSEISHEAVLETLDDLRGPWPS